MLSIGLDMVGTFSFAVPAAVESWISSAMVAVLIECGGNAADSYSYRDPDVEVYSMDITSGVGVYMTRRRPRPGHDMGGIT